jgi:hypothetical protein
MRFLYHLSTLYIVLLVAVVSSSFIPDTSSYDAYGLKLAANDVLLVESVPNQYYFSLQSPPDDFWDSCTVEYNDTNQYIYAVAVARQTTMNDPIRFVFIGVNTDTSAPFIGSLTYVDTNASDDAATIMVTSDFDVTCDGWNTTNYNIHTFNEFLYDTDGANNNHLDFFVVVVE